MIKNLRVFCLFCLFLFPFPGNSHVPNQSYIFLRVYEKDGIEGRFEINIREINKVFGLQLPNKATLKDLEPHVKAIQAYLLQHSSFNSEFGEHTVILEEVSIMSFNLGNFALFHFKLDKTRTLPDSLTVSYSAVFEKDDTHRGFLITEYNWKAGVINDEMNITLDFAPGNTESTMSLTEVSIWKGFVAMVKQGIWHIWIGLDHILFLFALILPSVVRRKTKNKHLSIWDWEAVKEFKPAFWYIIKVITFFTLAHTLTLSLASLEIVKLPSQLVESVIAFSIGLAALHNIRPIFWGRDWVIAFVFGLFHGFGFASVLGDIGLTNEFLTYSLLGFNVGVEIGQLVIIAAIFPILFLLRKSTFYPKLLNYGSALLIVISLYWVIERGLDINLGAEDFLRRTASQIIVFLGLR